MDNKLKLDDPIAVAEAMLTAPDLPHETLLRYIIEASSRSMMEHLKIAEGLDPLAQIKRDAYAGAVDVFAAEIFKRLAAADVDKVVNS